MLQARNGAGLVQKRRVRGWTHAHMQNLDGGKDLQVQVFREIDPGK
jgi:hypothetical protein